MESFKKSIGLRCAFCRSYEFALPYENYMPHPGSLVVCANCGRENDITSMLIFAKSSGVSLVREHVQQLVEELADRMRKAFKNR
ncbi:MAG: hypothetical protein CFE50_16055 [Pseudomonas sp. PGPPP4]|nr:MAG: hypothetical protein CFE50_16055 [Pseudomonas sp. PGPPP4]